MIHKSCTTFDDFIVGAPPYVEFKMPPFFEIQNEELNHTAVEFFNNDILKIPFPHVVFTTKYHEQSNPEFSAIPENSVVKIHVFEIDKTAESWKEKFKTIGDGSLCVHLFMQVNNSDFQLMYDPFIIGKVLGTIVKNYNYLTVAEAYHVSQPEKLSAVISWVKEMVLLNALVVSMPQFEHIEIERSEKLQRAREKNGKPPLGRMIQLKLRPELRAMCDSDGESGILRRPHWRRGHLRRLSSGKITPVSPCMVNFNGEVVEPKTYKVRN